MGKYRLVSLNSVHRKVKKQIVLRVIFSRKEKKAVTGTDRMCLSRANHVMIFYDEMASCVDNETAVNVISP